MRITLITALTTSTLLLAACGGGGAVGTDDSDGFDRPAMIETLLDHGLGTDVAACVAAGLTEQLTPGMYDEVVRTVTSGQLPTLYEAPLVYRIGLCDDA